MERKLATVLFVDLVNSTGLVTGADPEVVRRRVQNYFERVSRCVTAHGGIVEKFAGDEMRMSRPTAIRFGSKTSTNARPIARAPSSSSSDGWIPRTS